MLQQMLEMNENCHYVKYIKYISSLDSSIRHGGLIMQWSKCS